MGDFIDFIKSCIEFKGIGGIFKQLLIVNKTKFMELKIIITIFAYLMLKKGFSLGYNS